MIPLAVVGAAALALWGLSLWRRDASIADPAWGPAFALITATAMLETGPSSRGWLVLTLVSFWASRLGLHLLRRNLGHGEDPRYAAMRAQHGPRFWWVSLFTVFLLQAGLAWVIAWPLRVAVGDAGAWRIWDGIGVAVFAVGLVYEAVADAQLAAFRADPASKGQVMNRGLWAYSRHPNYFGDAVLWWGLGIIGAGAGEVWVLVGPAVMSFLLRRVSGVTLLEKDIGERRPGYVDYVRTTPAFVPKFW